MIGELLLVASSLCEWAGERQSEGGEPVWVRERGGDSLRRSAAEFDFIRKSDHTRRFSEWGEDSRAGLSVQKTDWRENTQRTFAQTPDDDKTLRSSTAPLFALKETLRASQLLRLFGHRNPHYFVSIPRVSWYTHTARGKVNVLKSGYILYPLLYPQFKCGALNYFVEWSGEFLALRTVKLVFFSLKTYFLTFQRQ